MPENTELRSFFRQTHFRMSWSHHQIQLKDGFLSYPPPFPPPALSPYTGNYHKQSPTSSGTRISPAVLFIIVILAVLFFISGLLHLLVRFLIKHPSSSASQSNRYPEISSSDALQRQLQQLFHLHDSGLDQAFIDALPVFHYKEIVGLKEPFDCPVCLCEFAEKDKLRLLPMCSHAFHINCIDTWLLSNSSCPLCRSTLYTPGYPIENPIFDFDDLGEEDGRPGIGESRFVPSQKTVEIEEHLEKSVLPVRLGKFRKVNIEAGESGEGETSSSTLDARRCYSMGSYQYILANSELRVALGNDRQNCGIKTTRGTTEHPGTDSIDSDVEGKKISNVSKGESYSVSKIWLWSKKGKFSSSTDTEMGMPSSLKMDLPWMEKPQGA